MPFVSHKHRVVRWRLCLSLLVIGTGATSATAQDSFLSGLFVNRTVASDPHADYSLRDENGPWLIVACTFSGDGDEAQAKELVLELRSRFHMRAYTHIMEFDFSESTDQHSARAAARRLRYQREESREIAVVVGDFSSVDDPQAQKTLQEIKRIVPKALVAKERGRTNQNFGMMRAVYSVLNKEDHPEGMTPMNKAFVAVNPLLPPEFFVAPGVDELVQSMNEGVPFSLLDCPGNFTVQVATFTGSVILDQRIVEEYEESGRLPQSKNNLEQAALNAHKLTLLLRDKGYEAYEFHDRYFSIVTVGAFAAVGTPRADGKTELDPRIYRTIEIFQGKPLDGGVNGLPGFQVKSVGAEKIPLDIQPKIVPVPRRAANAIKAGR